MDPIKNPFAPGAGSPPPELAGRGPLLEQTRIAVARVQAHRPAKSLILVGLRGVGKTVLLVRMREMAEEAGYKAVLVEAHEGKTMPELLVPSLRQILFSSDIPRIPGPEGPWSACGGLVATCFVGNRTLSAAQAGDSCPMSVKVSGFALI